MYLPTKLALDETPEPLYCVFYILVKTLSVFVDHCNIKFFAGLQLTRFTPSRNQTS